MWHKLVCMLHSCVCVCVCVCVDLSMGTVVVSVEPSSESVKARNGEGRGSPTVLISYCIISIPLSESLSDAVIGVV